MPATIQQQVGAKLRAAMKAQGLTVEQLGVLVGASKGDVSNVLNARRSITLRTLIKYADALGVELAIELNEVKK